MPVGFFDDEVEDFETIAAQSRCAPAPEEVLVFVPEHGDTNVEPKIL